MQDKSMPQDHRHLHNVQTYVTALKHVRSTLFEAAEKTPSDSQEQSQAFDAILTLDFMIQANACVVDYISDLIKLKNETAHHAVDRLVNTIEFNDSESIHDFMAALLLKIKTDGPELSTSLKTHYLLIKKNMENHCIGMSIVLCGPLAMMFILWGQTMAALIAFALFVIVGFLILNWYSPLIAHYRHLADAASVVAPSPFMYETNPDYSQNYTMTTRGNTVTGTFNARETSTEETISKKGLKTQLQHRFFHGAEKLSQQVETEYQSLLNANCI